MRHVHLHLFASAKGGVGKSTLAVLAAEVLAARGRRVQMWDADLTGTSLADGLLLAAPQVPTREDGTMKLSSPPSGTWMTPMQVWAARSSRRLAGDRAGRHSPPYLNDLLAHPGGADDDAEVCMAALAWRLEGGKASYYPSSSLEADIAQALSWIALPENAVRWAARMEQLLYAACQQEPELTDIVVDLPPGLYGFGYFALHLAGALLGRWELAAPHAPHDWLGLGVRWQINPFLITTDDRNGLLATVEGYIAMRRRLPELAVVINRNERGVREALGEIERYHPYLPMEGSTRAVAEHRESLGRLFRTGRLTLSDDLIQAAWKQLRLESAP